MNKVLKVIIVFSLIISFGCGKSRIMQNLVGSWDMQFFEQNPLYKSITWTFSADNKITKEINDTVEFVGTYSIISKITDKGNYIKITGLSEEYGDSVLANDDGTYYIHKLSSDQLVIQRVEAYGRTAGVYKWYEFVKK